MKLVVIFNVVLIHIMAMSNIAVAQVAMTPALWDEFLGNPPVDCNHLMIVEYATSDAFWHDKPSPVPFDASECNKLMPAFSSKTASAPLQKFMTTVLTEEAPEGDTLTEEQHAKRDRKNDVREKQLREQIHQNFAPLAKICEALGAAPDPGKMRVCLFGGSSATASLPFKTVFQAMVDNTRSNDEQVCTPDPITPASATTDEFRAFLQPAQKSLSWADIQGTLRAENFNCINDYCSTNVWSISIPGKDMRTREADYISPENFTLWLRIVEIHKGEWRVIGPPSRVMRCEEKNGKSECERLTEPTRGSSSGICYGGEDWHGFGGVMCLMNRCE